MQRHVFAPPSALMLRPSYHETRCPLATAERHWWREEFARRSLPAMWGWAASGGVTLSQSRDRKVYKLTRGRCWAVWVPGVARLVVRPDVRDLAAPSLHAKVHECQQLIWLLGPIFRGAGEGEHAADSAAGR